MSNVIKSKYVFLNEDKLITPQSTVSTKVNNNINQENDTDQLKILSRISKQNHILEAQKIIASAKSQATKIIQDAREEAEKEANVIAEQIYAKAKDEGYEEGLKEAKGKANELEAILRVAFESKLKKQEEDYNNLVKSLEPNLAKLMIGLINKITGVLIKNNQVIEHLISEAITNSDKSSQYIIRVSEEDFDTVNMQKEQLRSLVDESAKIEISIDKGLIKNQCIIDTDFGLIDCSLDVQLANLYQDIELLAIE